MSSEANPLASFRSKVAAKHPSGRITMRSVARSSADAQITLCSTVLTDVCEHNHGSRCPYSTYFSKARLRISAYQAGNR